MHLWDWRTGYNFQRVHAAVQPGSLDSESGIFACAFDQSESRLLTAEADKTIKVYREDDTAVSSLFHIHFKVNEPCQFCKCFIILTLLKFSQGKINVYSIKIFIIELYLLIDVCIVFIDASKSIDDFIPTFLITVNGKILH